MWVPALIWNDVCMSIILVIQNLLRLGVPWKLNYKEYFETLAGSKKKGS